MKPTLTLLSALLLAPLAGLQAADSEPSKSNIIVILADDLGYGPHRRAHPELKP
jgi:hypothetical protein